MPNTNKLSAVAGGYFALMTANKVALGFEDVFYGNQIKFPRTPALVVEPDTKSASIARAPRGTENIFLVDFLIVHMQVQDSQINRMEADLLADAVEDLINHKNNITLGGLVVHQFVLRMKSGFINRENSQFMSTLLTAEAQSLFQLPNSFS